MGVQWHFYSKLGGLGEARECLSGHRAAEATPALLGQVHGIPSGMQEGLTRPQPLL